MNILSGGSKYQKLSVQKKLSRNQWLFIISVLIFIIIVSCIILLAVFIRRESKNADSNVLVIGGWHPEAQSSIELYHPLNPELNRVIGVKMLQGRYGHTSTLMDDGSVITVGGNDIDVYLSSCERFTPSTSTVTKCPSLNAKRSWLASAILNGVLHICGGYDGEIRFESCEKLASNSSQYSVPMNTKRSNLAMVSLDGYLYAIGGYNERSSALSSVEHRSEGDDGWTYVKEMNSRRYGHSSAVVGGNIIVCGGYDGGSVVFPTIDQYIPTDNLWTAIKEMQSPWRYFGFVVHVKGLLALGGDQPFFQTVEIFSYKNDSWTMMTERLIHRRRYSSYILLPP